MNKKDFIKFLPKPNYDGPKSDLARYAFGYSDKKPGKSFWIIHLILVLIILFGLSGCDDPAFNVWVGNQRQECIAAGGTTYVSNKYQQTFTCIKREILHVKNKKAYVE